MEQHKILQDAKSAICNKPHSRAGGKSKGESCAKVDVKIQIAEDCIAARVEIMETCFQGGDQSHWGEVEKELKAINTCTTCNALKKAVHQCFSGD